MENKITNTERFHKEDITQLDGLLKQLATDASKVGRRPQNVMAASIENNSASIEASSEEDTGRKSMKINKNLKRKKREYDIEMTETEAGISGDSTVGSNPLTDTTVKSEPLRKKGNSDKNKSGGRERGILNPEAFMKGLRKDIPEAVRRFRATEEVNTDPFIGDKDDEREYSISTSDLLVKPKKKRKRPSAAEMRKSGGDETVSRDVPPEERLSDAELLKIGLDSVDETNRERWRKAPYCWNEKGFFYEEYHYLTEKRDLITNEYVWDDHLIWKFARDHKIETITSRQAAPGLLNAKGQIRKRAPRSTIAQRTSDGRYIKDVSKARKLSTATESQIIYERQEELQGERIEGVQRMNKERRDLEERAIKANEMIATLCQVGPMLSKAIRAHVDDLTGDLFKAIKSRNEALMELSEAKEEIARLTNIRQDLLETQQEYHRHYGPLPTLEQLLEQLNETTPSAEERQQSDDNHENNNSQSHPVSPEVKSSYLLANTMTYRPPTGRPLPPPEDPITEEADWAQLVMKQPEILRRFE